MPKKIPEKKNVTKWLNHGVGMSYINCITHVTGICMEPSCFCSICDTFQRKKFYTNGYFIDLVHHSTVQDDRKQGAQGPTLLDLLLYKTKKGLSLMKM